MLQSRLRGVSRNGYSEGRVDISVFLSSFSLIFLAELGDKTQITAMALAVRYPWKKVFIGLACAFALLNLGAVLVGKLLFAFLPLFWIRIASALLFLCFGVSTLRGAGKEEEKEQVGSGGRGPVATAFMMILMAECGDKTQLVTASLAAQHESQITVFAASTLALWAGSLLSIFLGRQLTRFVPLFWIHRAAGCLFFVFGGAILWEAFRG